MDKKVAIITGAAKGIGSTIAYQLTTDNCFGIIVDIDADEGLKQDK